jgi:hypothetical protein
MKYKLLRKTVETKSYWIRVKSTAASAGYPNVQLKGMRDFKKKLYIYIYQPIIITKIQNQFFISDLGIYTECNIKPISNF